MGSLNKLSHIRSFGFNRVGVLYGRTVAEHIILVYVIKLHAIQFAIVCFELTLPLVPSPHQRMGYHIGEDWSYPVKFVGGL